MNNPTALPGSTDKASRQLLGAFAVLWFTTGTLLLLLSAATFVKTIPSGIQPNVALAVLSGIETVAALLFLVPRSMRVGGAGLVGTLAFAFIAHALTGEVVPQLILYACCVGFVAAHGQLTRAQWRTLILGV